jgi:hypothetical protein
MTTDPKKNARDPAASLVQSTRVPLDLPTPATTPEAEKAKFALDPALCGVTVVRSFDGKFGQQDITSLLMELDAQIQRLRGGDMSAVEAMLFAQATALQAIFVDLATRAQRQERLPVMQAQLTMALKAQAQCRATLEALAEVKNPRHPTYVQQQNVAQQQVVSNSLAVACGHEKIGSTANKLITDSSHATLDSGGARATSRADTCVAAVASCHGAGDGGGKAASK